MLTTYRDRFITDTVGLRDYGGWKRRCAMHRDLMPAHQITYLEFGVYRAESPAGDLLILDEAGTGEEYRVLLESGLSYQLCARAGAALAIEIVS